MIRIETAIDIAAEPAEVWRVLARFDRWGMWNPFITAIDGAPAPGATLTVHVAVLGQASLPIRADLVTVVEGRELVWRSRLIAHGLFDRDHIIQLQPNATGCIVRNVQTFQGVAAAPAAMLTETAVRHGLTRMNEALKRRVEQDAGR